MRLKYGSQVPWSLISLKKIWTKKSSRILTGFLYTLAIFFFGVFIHNTGYFGETLKPVVKENVNLIPKMVAGMLSKPENIIIDIKHKHFQRLAYQREVALKKGLLIVSDDDYVPATIRYKDKSVKVRVRLKGDHIDQLQGRKWSFRIKVKGENTLFSMKQFSLHHPGTRQYIYEWLFQQALRREDILSLRYDFITVTLNGKDLGVYALEEHFEKRLIEHNQLREGPIVRFNENLMWEELEQQSYHFPNAQVNGSGTYLSSDIDGFHTNKMLSDSASQLHYFKAIYMLESFRRGKLKTSEVFDVPKLSMFFAITDLMGAEHGSRWHNTRFYYNPITSRLEPIGFDGKGFEVGSIKSIVVTKQGYYTGDDEYYTTLFKDRIFFREYIKALEYVSETSYLDQLLSELEDKLNENLSILYKEFPTFHFSRDILYNNQKYILSVMNPIKGLHAYFHKSSPNHLQLELGNIQSLPIKVLNATYKDSFIFKPVREIVLSAKLRSNQVDYRNVSFPFPENFAWSNTMISDLKVNYKIIGASHIRYETVFPWSQLSENLVKNDFIKQNSNAHTFGFFTTDESTKRIFIKAGVHNVDKNLIIPKGYRVICGEDTQLNLSNAAKILSFSPVEFVGSEDSPILIQSTDSTGQGLIVMKANETSVLEYVTFNNLSSPSQGGWEMTGAVTFYESPVDISHCRFISNRSEDGLNIIRSEFTIDMSLFKHTFSDAFDADFTKGKITNSSFVDCGNDAMDVSGSVVEVQDVIIKNVGDKGLSAGENSQLIAHEVEIKDAEIAVASKDMSKLEIDNVSIEDSKIGFTVFQKKPEFGYGSITAKTVFIDNVTIPYLVEDGSFLRVDGEIIEPSRKNVKEILYGVEYGKSSRR